MRTFEPATLTVLTTSTCTAACRHCSMNSSPQRRERLSWAQLESVLRQAFESLALRIVVFSGGEPTLLGDDLLRALALCREHGVKTRVVTNGYWATSPEAAAARVASLREAGLDELNVSTDDFHLPWISLQRVRYAYDAALQAGFDAVVLSHCSGPESALHPERLRAWFGGGELRLRFGVDGQTESSEHVAGGTQVILSNGNIQQIGRTIEAVSERELDDRDDLDAAAERIGGCPWAIRGAAVTPGGHLAACCGFELEGNPILDYGDLREVPLAGLLDRADGDLISNMIAVLGPPKIRRLLERLAPGEAVFPRERYRTYCEVCSDLVGRPENREALYRHQGAFIDAVMAGREAYEARYTQGDRVRIPLGETIPISTHLITNEGRSSDGE